MKQINVVLASASPRRKDLLEQIGIFPTIVPSDVDEKTDSDIPDQVVTELSRRKAEHVWTGYAKKTSPAVPGADVVVSRAGVVALGADVVVLGADTVVSVEGRILGKPRDEQEAIEMISLLSGRIHQVYTGVTLIGIEGQITFSEKTDVFVSRMTNREVREYVACGESMDKAGAYGIQGHFAAYIDRIEGSYTNVMGLPVGRVYQKLKQLTKQQTEEQND